MNMGEKMKLTLRINDSTRLRLSMYNLLGYLFFIKVITKSSLPRGFWKYSNINEFVSLD